MVNGINPLRLLGPNKMVNEITTIKIESNNDMEDFKGKLNEIFDMKNQNAYANTYFNALEISFKLYGYHGVRTQLIYLLSNIRAKTDEAKKSKKLLNKMIKDRYKNGNTG